MGGNAYTEAIQKELSLPFDGAERAKKGEPVDGIEAADVAPILRTVTENLLLEIQKTFDFFKATAASDRIDRVLVSGGASRVDGFVERLAERFGTPVELLDPVPADRVRRRRGSGSSADDVAPTAAVAVGLALRRAGDR